MFNNSFTWSPDFSTIMVRIKDSHILIQLLGCKFLSGLAWQLGQRVAGAFCYCKSCLEIPILILSVNNVIHVASQACGCAY